MRKETVMASIVALVAASMVFVAASSAVAQAPGVQLELGGYAGYTFSEGIDGNTDLGRVDITPKSGLSYGASAGLWLNPWMEIGFLWSQQQSDLRVRAPFEDGRTEVTFTTFKINNYHGFFAYHWGDRRAPVKPFFLFGMGATSYPEIQEMGETIPGNTRFSTTWALGVKMFPNNGPWGVTLMGRWTPTYITSDPGGVWCDPYWGCSSYSNPKYSNQFDLTVGLNVRLGG